jgi:hypothetical protein
VFPSARRRKLKMFEGFRRRAVVVMPSNDVYKQRAGPPADETATLMLNNMKSEASFSRVVAAQHS